MINGEDRGKVLPGDIDIPPYNELTIYKSITRYLPRKLSRSHTTLIQPFLLTPQNA